MQDAHAYLSAHNRLGFFVRQFASHKEINLLELLHELLEGQPFKQKAIDLSEHRQLSDHVLKKLILSIGDLEVSEELRNR